MLCKELQLFFSALCLWAVAGLGIADPGLGGATDLDKRKAALESGVPLVLVKANSARAASGSGGNYIRYSEQGKEAKLQTAISRFVRSSDGAIVDLIGVIHVADKAYYKELDQRMIFYDAVLYEMVGGPYNPAIEKMALEEGAPLEGLAMVHGMIQNLLKLEYQKDGIDYTRNNFVHADVDWRKFQQLSEEKNETIATWFERAMKLAKSEDLPGIPNTDEESRAVLGDVIGSMINGDATTLKRTLAPVLSEAELLITRMEGENGSVLVTERNKVAIGVVSQQLRLGKRKLAVFYGAAHMPDLDKRLLQLGFIKSRTEWLTAWDIRDDPAVKKNNLIGELLKNERIGGLLKSAMKLLNQAKGSAESDK